MEQLDNSDGESQLIVDADDEHAWAEMSTEHTSYDQILDQMDQDDSISSEDKQMIISSVLNGRWFSSHWMPATITRICGSKKQYRKSLRQEK